MPSLHHLDNQEETKPGSFSSATQKPSRQPLGILLFCRRNSAWHQASTEQRNTFDLNDPAVLKCWEQKMGGRIFRIYASDENVNGTWEFFTLLEFHDLPAWSQLQEELEASEFGTYFDWDIAAFGRSAV
ncbi:MAG: hypothetical protein O2954_09475 [bacterium]|nr:hypothetical protein [bacterium]